MTKKLTIRTSKMVAITVRYLGPTNFHGSRLKASCEKGRPTVTIPKNCASERDASYEDAARALCLKMGWTGSLVGGETPNGMVYVFTEDRKSTRLNSSHQKISY